MGLPSYAILTLKKERKEPHRGYHHSKIQCYGKKVVAFLPSFPSIVNYSNRNVLPLLNVFVAFHYGYFPYCCIHHLKTSSPKINK